MDYSAEFDKFEPWPEDMTEDKLMEICKNNGYNNLTEFVLKFVIPDFNSLFNLVNKCKDGFEDVINRYSEILEIVCRGCPGQDDDGSNYNTCPRLIPRPKSNKPTP